ncbi:MAG: SoxR reducing system RseC family protein [Draconibacterium sp.]|nr:SoxR reducing system RseC family protein [Draconibacterium sp.]
MENETWSVIEIKRIDEKLSGTKEKDLRFYRISEFKRNIKRIEEFSGSCSYCENQKADVNKIISKIDEAIKVPGKSRKEYDRIIGRLSSHMRKEHGFYVPYFFTYLYSFIGMLGGVILGLIIMNIFPDYKLEILSAGFVLGLLPTYVIGHIKDKRIRSQKKLM